MATSASRWRRVRRILLVGLLLAIPIVLLRTPFVRRVLVELVEYMRAVPVPGIALFLAIETLALLITTPIWLMSGIAGYAYGFVWGLALAWPAVTMCASIVFLVGRAFARKIVAARSSESHFWRAVDHAVRANGFKVAFLMRIAVAIPQNLATYMLSATPLRLRDFALGSFCGLLPATAFQVYVGANVESAAALVSGQQGARGPIAWVAFIAGFALTLGVLIGSSRYARRVLDQTLAQAARGEG